MIPRKASGAPGQRSFEVQEVTFPGSPPASAPALFVENLRVVGRHDHVQGRFDAVRKGLRLLKMLLNGWGPTHRFEIPGRPPLSVVDDLLAVQAPVKVGGNEAWLLLKVLLGPVLEMDRQLGSLGLTSPQYATLAALERAPQASNADLARAAFVTPQTMNRLVLQLEQRALLQRHPHPTHGRILQAELTATGKKALKSAHAIVARIETRLVKDIPKSAHPQLREWLTCCAEALEPSPRPF